MTLRKTCILAFTSIFLSAIQAFSPAQSIQAKDHPFGPNVYIMYPTDDMTKVHETVEKIHDEMFKEHFGDGRYAILFAPGDYREAGLMKVPFFVHMAGLGKTPYDVKLSNVHTPVHLANDNGTCTFWRSLENLSVIGQESYEEDEMFKWAVSQAAPIRRVYSERTVKNQWKNGWVSGGFTADCHFMGAAGSDGQQQWYTRNTYLDKGRGRFREGSWNYMFQGVELGEGADKSTYVNNWDKGGNVTFLPSTPVIREKPFIFMDEKGRFKVFKPALRRDAVGVSYSRESMGKGEIIDIKKDFYIVAPGTSAKQINKQLARGKHILFQPGIFELEEPLHVTKAGTIVMGLGWSTLIPGKGNEEAALIVDDLDDVTVCSILFDAYYTSHSLLTMRGEGRQHDNHPSLLSDVFFRVGGVVPHPVHVDTALEIQANDVVGDHFWIWRADHGLRNSVGWEVNTSDIGLHVTGDDVTIYGLFNEHFQKYQTLWEGERGRTYFYQCETPYDAGYQSRYMSENGTRAGYCAYKVADSVNAHEATGLGIYDVYFGTDIRMENSMEVPEKPGIRIFHLCNVSLSDSGPRGIGYMINGRVASTFQTYRVCRPYINEFVGGSIDAYHEGSNESSIKTLENWQFSSDSTSWASVTVPHSYNAIDGHSKSYYRGKGYYTTTVSLKAGQCAKLLFEGAAQAATVYVNGRLASSHKGGYTPFFVDITALAHEGENYITVVCDNSVDLTLAPIDSDFNKNGGLHNPVRLYTLPATHIGFGFGMKRMHVSTPEVSKDNAKVLVETQIEGALAGYSAVVRVRDAKGTVCKAAEVPISAEGIISASLEVSHPHLWNGTVDPYLYTATVELRKGDRTFDSASTRFGIRTIEMTLDEGFKLNGVPYSLRGTSIHQDKHLRASALTREDYIEDYEIVKELGCNFVRLAHYPHNDLAFDICDELGLIVQTEIPWVNICGVDAEQAYFDNLHEQMTEMVTSLYNHPCIAFWGMWNELDNWSNNSRFQGRLDEARVLEQTASLHALAKGLDPYRYVGVTDDSMLTRDGYPKLQSDYISENRYYGWYYGSFDELQPAMTALHDSGYITNISEYGAGVNPYCQTWNPEDINNSDNSKHFEQWGNLFHEAYLTQIVQMPWLNFTSIWVLFDFAVASRLEGYKNSSDGVHFEESDERKYTNDKGLVTRDRKLKKDAFYLYKAKWNKDEATVYIAGKRLESAPEGFEYQLTAYSNAKSLALYRQTGSNEPELIQTLEGSGEPTGVIWKFAPVKLEGPSTILKIVSETGLEDSITLKTL